MPQPSLMMSITGPAICAHFADDYEFGQAVSRCCGIDNGTRAQIHRAGEVAQSTARAFVSRRFCWAGCALFPALGGTEAVWDNSYYRRRPRAGKDSADPCLPWGIRSEEHTSELQSLAYLVCRLLLEK